jgi:Mrp family chromosome partitioning ATPase/capsular polysaccharide biosynthesis protein
VDEREFGSTFRLTLRALRRGWWIVVLAVTAGALSALALDDTQPGYEATAEIVVTPLPESDQTLLGLGILRSSRESQRAIQTAALLLRSSAAARAAGAELGEDPADLLNRIDVEIVGESNVVAVTASSASPDRAAEIANVFARTTVETQTRRLRETVERVLTALRARREQLGADDPSALPIDDRISALEAVLASGRDPTIALGQSAEPPREAAGPSTPLLLLLGGLAGLVAGLGAVTLRERFTRRVNAERALTSIYPLPVLARVPLVRRPFRRRRQVAQIPPRVREAFRTAVAQLERSGERGGEGRVVLVTSPNTCDGRTTAVACIAETLAEAGHAVVAVDADLRSPLLGRTLGVEGAAWPEPSGDPPRGPATRLLSETVMEGLEVLPVLPADPERLLTAQGAIPAMLAELRREFDWIIVDTPAIGEVSDALRLLASADDVLLLCRLDHSRRSSLRVTRELLEHAGARPLGTLLLGATAPSADADAEPRDADVAVA